MLYTTCRLSLLQIFSIAPVNHLFVIIVNSVSVLIICFDIHRDKYSYFISSKFQNKRHIIGRVLQYFVQGIIPSVTLICSSGYLFHLQHSEKCDANERYALAQRILTGVGDCRVRHTGCRVQGTGCRDAVSVSFVLKIKCACCCCWW